MRRILLSLLLSALLCCMLTRLLCTGVCICLPKTPISSEAQLRSYLEGVDKTRRPALVRALQGVQDEESARQALAEIFRLGCSMREDYEQQWEGAFDTTPGLHSLADLAHLEHASAALLEVEKQHNRANRELYLPLLREVERLRSANFYERGGDGETQRAGISAPLTPHTP